MKKTIGLGFVVLSVGGALVIAGCNSGASTAETQPVATKPDEPKSSTPAVAEHTGDTRPHTTKLEFSSSPEKIPVGQPVNWTLKITDAKSGAPVNDFEIEMTKQMHLIVVKKDLSWFNHLHPTYKGNGVFTVQATLPTAGSYKIYADYTPKDKAQEVPQHEIATGGQTPMDAGVLLEPSPAKNGWMTEKVSSHPEGEPNATGGAAYQVALMPMPAKIVAGKDVMLHFQIRDAAGKPLKDLQPYLGAMGHCVILSSDTNSYLHSHPMAGGAKETNHDMGGMKMDGDMKGMDHSAAPKSGGPDVIFHTNFPAGGMYKAWGQFKHKGKIITAPFVLAVNAATSPTTATPDESKPHSH